MNGLDVGTVTPRVVGSLVGFSLNRLDAERVDRPCLGRAVRQRRPPNSQPRIWTLTCSSSPACRSVRSATAIVSAPGVLPRVRLASNPQASAARRGRAGSRQLEDVDAAGPRRAIGGECGASGDHAVGEPVSRIGRRHSSRALRPMEGSAYEALSPRSIARCSSSRNASSGAQPTLQQPRQLLLILNDQDPHDPQAHRTT